MYFHLNIQRFKFNKNTKENVGSSRSKGTIVVHWVKECPKNERLVILSDFVSETDLDDSIENDFELESISAYPVLQKAEKQTKNSERNWLKIHFQKRL